METTKSVMRLEIITPLAIILDEEVSFVLARAKDGDFGILPGHAPLIASLQEWALKYVKDDKEYYATVFGGYLEIDEDKITVVSPIAELAESIDEERVKRAKIRAEARLKKQDLDVDVIRAEAALKRSILRMHVLSNSENKE